MKEFCGYGGNILTVNLNDKEARKEPLREEFVNKYVGGEGFALRLLWERLKPGVDALSPENPLIFSIGAMCGSPMTSTARMFSTSKSPVTGG